MKKSELRKIIRESIKELMETRIQLNEAEKCGFVNCECKDGTKYSCKDNLATEPNCYCCSPKNCGIAKDLLDGGKVAGSGGKGIKLSKIRAKKTS